MKDSSWFSAKVRSSHHKNKGLEPESPMIGIMSFEVSKLMCKVVNLWHCLSDRNLSLLKQELRYSPGIRTLISDDQAYLINLALAEIIDILRGVAASVARLGKKCVDPIYHNLDRVFDNPFEIDPKWCEWEYRLKKMEKRVKKMKRFTDSTSQLLEQLDSLSEKETRLIKMESNRVNQGQMQEFHQKVTWQREEVTGLREMSPWFRSYDYIVRLLLRSLLTIAERIKIVFGISNEFGSSKVVVTLPHGSCFVRKNSISTCTRASVYPSEKSMSNLGHTPVCGRHPSSKPQSCQALHATLPIRVNFQNDVFDHMKKATTNFFNVSAKQRLSNVQEPTLGNTSLALRYANIIIFVETLAMSPRCMSPNARDDLYDMLTTNIKELLREKLCLSRKEALVANEEGIASHQRLSFQRIQDWLSPLAHNMIKWYSERNFNQQPIGSAGNVLLVQTLYYADQATSEIAITELLVGLHYVFKFSQELIIDKSPIVPSLFK
uniref:protein PSK SIMULATOR 1-like n=1 Tax=Erigeron canadensis TaxID=72917 RepID=UPI001CB89813|nr:protein PSK SIMULATOR 1-like [Erigeron canadensis]